MIQPFVLSVSSSSSESEKCPAIKALVLDRPRIMGILNITPDSFSDGGKHFDAGFDPDTAIQSGLKMLADGADILDVGGESTRPGAAEIPVAEEIQRVIPVISGLVAEGARVSVDTSKPAVMEAAVGAGAFMINDVCALQVDGALSVAADLKVPVCLMHMQGTPRTMQQHPEYANVVTEVRDFLLTRVRACTEAGLDQAQIVIDPGFGFGKTLAHNLSLLKALDTLAATGQPVLIGLSRKSMFGKLLDLEVDERLVASVTAALLGVQRGAHIVRVHDVAETAQALDLYHEVVTGR